MIVIIISSSGSSRARKRESGTGCTCSGLLSFLITDPTLMSFTSSQTKGARSRMREGVTEIDRSDRSVDTSAHSINPRSISCDTLSSSFTWRLPQL